MNFLGFVWDRDCETMSIGFHCVYKELTAAPPVAGTGNNTNPVLLQVKIAYIPMAVHLHVATMKI